jgi:hypothetical protein
VGIVIVFGILPKVLPEVSGLQGLGILIQVDDFRVNNGSFLSLLRIIVNLL